MESARVRLRRRLFRQGAAAANALAGYDGIYFCPICKREFDTNALELRCLTLEDVPPKALGGRPIILTCKDCNNTAGHTVDAAAANREKQDQFLQTLIGGRAGFGGRAKLKIGGVTINIDLHNEGEVKTLKVIAENDPKRVKKTREYLDQLADENRWEGEEFKITAAATYHARLARVSELRTAFLAATAAFGYRYAFDPSLDRVREQILKPKEEILARWWMSMDFNHPRPVICIAEREGVVLVKYMTGGTILPFPPSGSKGYEKFLATSSRKIKFKLKGRFFEWPKSFIAAIDHKNAELAPINPTTG